MSAKLAKVAKVANMERPGDAPSLALSEACRRPRDRPTWCRALREISVRQQANQGTGKRPSFYVSLTGSIRQQNSAIWALCSRLWPYDM